jgi:hypothetical protein
MNENNESNGRISEMKEVKRSSEKNNVYIERKEERKKERSLKK